MMSAGLNAMCEQRGYLCFGKPTMSKATSSFQWDAGACLKSGALLDGVLNVVHVHSLIKTEGGGDALGRSELERE